ncbi:hypothetical protein SLA2020_236400 [Shorea laevis]
MQLNGGTFFSGFHQEHNLDRASYMINPPDFMTPIFELGYLDNHQRNMHMAFPGSMAHVAESLQWFFMHLLLPVIAIQCIVFMLLRIKWKVFPDGNYRPMRSFHAAPIKWKVFPISDMVMPALLRQGKEL